MYVPAKFLWKTTPKVMWFGGVAIIESIWTGGWSPCDQDWPPCKEAGGSL